MRIGVISDTHIPERADKIPDKIIKAFKEVDMILHAGDLVEISVYDELKKIKPTKAVYGNMDPPEVRKILEDKEIIEVGRYKLGLIHGWGHPAKLLDLAKSRFNEKLDIIVFGHSHHPVNEERGGILFFNPGSPTDKIFSAVNTYGILEIGNTIKGEIIKI